MGLLPVNARAKTVRHCQQVKGSIGVADVVEPSTPASEHQRALDGLADRREVRLGGISFAGRRRRPSGEKPPLPRSLETSGWFWLIAGAATVLIWSTLFIAPASADFWTRLDHRVLEWFVDARTPVATDVLLALHALGSVWFIRPLRWLVIAVLVGFRQWRLLIASVIAFIAVDTIVRALADTIGRPRPFVPILGDWAGYSHPSAPVALLAVTLVALGMALLPEGRWRRHWFVAAGLVAGLLGLARIYLGTDHPTDVLIGLIIGAATGVLTFRVLAPATIYPVGYRRGRTAHLDISGRRREALISAFRQQLGLAVQAVDYWALEGSSGSTPLRIELESGEVLFAKIYSSRHLRADRWYKVARTILYGTLEDEVRFTSVRRLVEYEDYILLKLAQAGLPVPATRGFVEITPEREYAIVTEFLQDAEEIGDVEIDDNIIDGGLQIVRRLWDAGLAHRDIKPANVMVKGGQVVLIDPAFATVRPSPWRQAVDLANMMIILSLRSSPEHVYERALQYFSPEDIAEAFAATRGVTIPAQSRVALAEHRRKHGVDIVQSLDELSPQRDHISIQRWSLRRIGLAVSAALALWVLLMLLFDNLTGGGFI